MDDPILKHLADLQRIESGQWLAAQARRWTCACGARFSWYETTCPKCGAALDSYGPDPIIQPPPAP